MTEYTNAINVADALIKRKGRDVILERTSISKDEADPWNVPENARAEYWIKAVFLEYANSEVDGTLVQTGDQKVFIAAKDLAVEPSTKDKILDGSDIWSIKQVNPLKPGNEAVIYTLQVRR